MEIKVGEYVRTIHGEIAIFRGWNNNPKSQWSCKLEFQKNKTWKYCCEEYIKSYSPNIIDLIEIGDYVNGNKVRCFKKENCDYDIGFDYNDDYGEYFGIDAEDIKTIVTHEQFAGMEYKV